MNVFPALLFVVLARPDDPPQVEPPKAPRDQVCHWQAEDGLPYQYRVPKDWKADGTGNLTVVLHGNGLDERWTFFNHPAGEFRPDDVVVSPDGTTYVESMKNDEFLGEKKDADRFHALLLELRESFQPARVFLYGHSQGSFFVFYYAGEYPDDVDGVLGHASGVWNWTKQSKKGQHQAIAFLHGTEDHIPYGQSWWGRKIYEEKGYPHVHLRTLNGWDHRPHHFQAALGLAWCEGMVSDRPERVAVCLETLADPKVPMGMDLVALHDVAGRLADLETASSKDRARAKKLKETLDEFSRSIVEQVEKELGKKGRVDTVLEAGKEAPALGLVVRADEDLRGMPDWVAFRKSRDKEFSAAEKAAGKAIEKFWSSWEKDPGAAAIAVVDLLENGAVHRDVPRVLDRLADLDLTAKEVRLPKKVAGRLEQLVGAYRRSRDQGFQDFERQVGKVRW